MSYQTSSKRSQPFWLLIGARKLLCFSAQSEARMAATVWNWSGKTLVFRPLRLSLAPTIRPWVSEDEVSSSPLLDGLGWENLISIREKHKAILVFKSLRSLAPVYLRQMFCAFSANYDLRNSINKHALHKARTEYLKRSFSYSGAALWNSLSQNLRQCNSLGVF